MKIRSKLSSRDRRTKELPCRSSLLPQISIDAVANSTMAITVAVVVRQTTNAPAAVGIQTIQTTGDAHATGRANVWTDFG